MLVETTTGMEQIVRAIALNISIMLEGALQQQEEKWQGLDQDYASALGVPYEPITLEPVTPDHIYDGHRPSLIEAPPERYPNVAIMAFDGNEAEDLRLDQAWTYTVVIQIEIMVKAGPYEREDQSGEGEQLVNRRIQRTVDAVLNVLAYDVTLGGLVIDVARPPATEIANVFRRAVQTGRRGPVFLWQGAVITWNVSIPIPMP